MSRFFGLACIALVAGCGTDAKGIFRSGSQYDAFPAWPVRVEYDANADGFVDETTRWTYDQDGLPLGWVAEVPGFAPQTAEYHYDAKGRIAWVDGDENSDGEPEGRWIFEHEPDSVTITWEDFRPGWSTYVSKVHYEGPRPIAVTLDNDADGSVDSFGQYMYEEYTRLVSLMHDHYNDGVVDAISTYQWEDDSITKRETESLATGTKSDVYLFSYETR